MTWETDAHSRRAELSDIHASVEALTKQVEELHQAFPDGIESHRKYHAELMAKALHDKEFIREIKLDAAKKGIWFFVITVAGLLVIGLQLKLKAFIAGG